MHVARCAAAAFPANIGNRVWLDANGNGVQDAEEVGVAGVTVDLVTADRAVLVDSTTTNASGSYTLVGEVPGAYRIRIHVPAGYAITRQNVGADEQTDSDVASHGGDYRYSDPFPLASNVISTVIYDAGLVQATSTWDIGNFVWRDLNANGVQDGGEPGVAGVQVELWNASETERLGTATTNALGTYSLTAPTPILVRFRVIPPAGHEFAPADAGDDGLDSDVHQTGVDAGFSDPFVALCCAGVSQHDAGLVVPSNPANVGNLVWSDTDGDGVRDAGEPGLAGVTVQLWNADRTALLDTDVTNGSGIYTVTGDVPGSFRIRVVPPNGYQLSPTESGADDAIDSDVDSTTRDAGFSAPFTLGPNVPSVTTYDVGLVAGTDAASIGNYVWFDANYDGVQGAGEASVAGITVELWDAARSQLVDTDVTDLGGLYQLAAPRPGQYRIRIPVAASDGLQFTLMTAGGDNALDSNIHPWGADHEFSDPFLVSSFLLSNPTFDAGLLSQPIPEPAAALATGMALVALALLPRSRHEREGRRSDAPR